MKSLLIVGFALFFLISLLKKAIAPKENLAPAQSGEEKENQLAALGKRAIENPGDAGLWAEWAAATYALAAGPGEGPYSPLVQQADERFRTAASLAPEDASILVDWAQWAARVVMDDDDLRMPTYRKTVEPMLRKAARLAPNDGAILYHHGLLLREIVISQEILSEELKGAGKEGEFQKLEAEREALLWDGLDFADGALYRHHEPAAALALKAEFFSDLGLKHEEGERKYLFTEARACLDARKKLGAAPSDLEDLVIEVLAAMQNVQPLRVSRNRPATIPGASKSTASAPEAAQSASIGAATPASHVRSLPIRSSAAETQPAHSQPATQPLEHHKPEALGKVIIPDDEEGTDEMIAVRVPNILDTGDIAGVVPEIVPSDGRLKTPSYAAKAEESLKTTSYAATAGESLKTTSYTAAAGESLKTPSYPTAEGERLRTPSAAAAEGERSRSLLQSAPEDGKTAAFMQTAPDFAAGASAPGGARERSLLQSAPKEGATAALLQAAPDFAAGVHDFSRAAAAMSPSMPGASNSGGDFQGTAPAWDAPAYNVPDYARQKTGADTSSGAAQTPLAGGVHHPLGASPTTARPEPEKTAETGFVGGHQPLGHRPLGR